MAPSTELKWCGARVSSAWPATSYTRYPHPPHANKPDQAGNPPKFKKKNNFIRQIAKNDKHIKGTEILSLSFNKHHTISLRSKEQQTTQKT